MNSLAQASSSSTSGLANHGSDSVYLQQARIIQNKIEDLHSVAQTITELKSQGKIHARLLEARSLALNIHDMIKDFHLLASTDLFIGEKSQRKMMYKKFKIQYQSALNAIDTAAQNKLGSRGLLKAGSEVGGVLADSDSDCIFSDAARLTIRNNYPSSFKSHKPRSNLIEPLSMECLNETRKFTTGSEKNNSPYFSLEENVKNSKFTSARDLGEGVKKLEQDVQGIHNLYKEMAWHIAGSVQDLDAIESQMRSTVSYSETAAQELASSLNMIKTRRNLLYFFTLLGLLAFVYVVYRTMI